MTHEGEQTSEGGGVAEWPLVSVVIPTFDRVTYLREALQSVRAQSYPHWEAVVVDDGSTDGTAEFLKGLDEPRVRVVHLAHTGVPSKVRNAGIAAAQGQYLALLDSDDLWDPRKLEIQLCELRERPPCRWSYTNFWRIHENGKDLTPHPPANWVPYSGWILEHLVAGEAIVPTPTVLVERDLVAEAGGFDESLVLGEDYDLWFRLATRAQAIAVDRRLATIRRHRARSSHGRAREAHECSMWSLRKVLQSAVDRGVRRACRRQLAYHAARLADVYSAEGEPWRAVGTFSAGVRYHPGRAALWWVLPKLLLRPVTPRWLRSLYRRFKDRGIAPRGEDPGPRAQG